MLYYTILYYIVLYYIILYYIILYHIILYYIYVNVLVVMWKQTIYLGVSQMFDPTFAGCVP
jgi:hypothetical protein